MSKAETLAATIDRDTISPDTFNHYAAINERAGKLWELAEHLYDFEIYSTVRGAHAAIAEMGPACRVYLTIAISNECDRRYGRD